jgi:hypothetical protein
MFCLLMQVGPEKATADMVRSAGGLGNVPLIVLTQGSLSQDSSSGEARVQREWIELQRTLARRSARGRQIVVNNSGHGIPLQAPEAVVSAVREIVQEVRIRQ